MIIHTPDYGDVVLAEYTLPFNEADVTYFRPLYQQTVLALKQYPTHITADAAYDAWYVYEQAARHGGIAAVPLNAHTANPSIRDREGVPLCSKGLRMLPTFQFAHTSGYRAQHFQCPLLYPQSTGETCGHLQFLKGKGCVKDLNWERGDSSACSWIEALHSTRRFIRNEPVVNASTVRHKYSELNAPKSTIVARLLI